MEITEKITPEQLSVMYKIRLKDISEEVCEMYKLICRIDEAKRDFNKFAIKYDIDIQF